MSQPSTLPTNQEADIALACFSRVDQNEHELEVEPWRQIVMRSLAHATQYDTIAIYNNSNHDDSSGGDGGDKLDDSLVLYTLKFLLGALTRFHSKPTADLTDSYSTSFYSADAAARVSPESTLADVLWLFGAMLEPLSADLAKNNYADEYKALGKVVYGLVHGHSSFGNVYKLIPLNLFQKTLSATLLSSSFVQGVNGQNFMKKLRKLNTDMFYRQKKVNLMQEESEGYAKLLSFLVSLPSVDSDFSIKDYSEGCDESAIIENKNCGTPRALEQTALRVKELIGAFDLDPNRVLDLTLDALEAQLHSLVITREKKIGGNREEWDKLVRHDPDHAVAVRLLLEIVKMFPKENVTHLIGFKFSSYVCSSTTFKNKSAPSNGITTGSEKEQKSKKEEAKRTTTGLSAKQTPKSLYLTTAILCSHTLLSLPHLLPHLEATVSTLLKMHVSWAKEYKVLITKMGVISLNSSNKAEVGGRQGAQSPSDIIKQIEASCEGNQMVQLLQTLIEVGLDWEDVTELFPQNSNTTCERDEKGQCKDDAGVIAACLIHPPLGQSLCRYILTLVEELYDARIKDVGMELCNPPILNTTKQNLDVGFFSLLPYKSKKGPGSLTSSSTLLQLSQVLAKPLLPVVETGCISSQPVLYCKLCRLVRILLLDQMTTKQNVEESIILKEPIFNLLHKFLIPSLSLFPRNPSISAELWSVLSLLPYQIRYVLYDYWRKPGLEKAALRGMSTVKKPFMQIESEVNTANSTRYLLKRMSKDNIRDMGKQISKVSHNNPLVVFTLILNQIESYDNFISLIVEAFKFVGTLSLDVLGYCLLLSLGGGERGDIRAKVKDDGVSAAQWLSSLETFAGAFYKKFSDIELRGLLAYLTKRLKDGHLLELGVLQSLLKVTGGYDFADCESTVALSQVQLEGRCGTQLLKRETSDFGIVKKFNAKSSTRLRSLLQEDAIGVVYLVLLSQARSRVLFGDSEGVQKEIKLIGNLNDSCRKTMYILQTCLTDFYEVGQHGIINEEGRVMVKSFPTLGELFKDYGVDTAAAWMLCRPLVHAAAFAAEAALAKTGMINGESNTNLLDIPSYLKRFYSSSDEMRSDYQSMIPEESWQYISPLLFERFYSLSIYDLYCPEKRYETEIARLKKDVEKLSQLQRGGKNAMKMKSVLAAAAAAAGGTQKEIREASTFSKIDEQELERTKGNSEILTSDLARQKKHCEAISLKLLSEKLILFHEIDGTERQLRSASYFLTHCVYPRAILSPDDALYASHFIKRLHLIETPGFFTLQIFDCLVNAVIASVYCITENEAANLGILLEETWRLISSWRYNKELYEKECASKPGATWSKVKDDGEGDAGEKALCSMSHADYVNLYNRWHAQLSSTFIGGLKSTEYMHTRITLVLLTRIVDHFPTKSKVGEKFLAVLEPLQGDENRMQDIKLMAKAYKSQISKTQWKEEDSKVTEARLEKERELQIRKKKAEKQFDDLKRGSEKPSREYIYDPRKPDRRNKSQRPSDPRQSERRERDLHAGDDKSGRTEPLAGRWESSSRGAVDEKRGKRARSPDRESEHIRKRTRQQAVSSPDVRRGNRDRRQRR